MSDEDDGINSDTLWPAIETAIQQVLTEHGGGMIEACVGMVDYIGADGNHRFASFARPEQFHVQTIGMTQALHARELEIQRINIQADLMDEGAQYDE